MKRAGFTTIELMIAVVVIGILASMAMAGYRGYRDRAAMLVDETNQKVLAAAVKLYAYDHNALPGSLSDLRRRDMERAYAWVTTGKRPYTFLVYLEETLTGRTAWAHGGHGPGALHEEYYQNDPKILRCPSDTNGGVSYQINSFFTTPPNNTLSAFLNPANSNRILIFESDVPGNGADPETQAAVDRHQGGQFVTTTPGGQPGRGNTGGGRQGARAARRAQRQAQRQERRQEREERQERRQEEREERRGEDGDG